MGVAVRHKFVFITYLAPILKNLKQRWCITLREISTTVWPYAFPMLVSLQNVQLTAIAMLNI